MLSLRTVKRIMIALASQHDGAELANAVNWAASAMDQSGQTIAAAITATATSTTTDFGSLKVNDLLVHIAATPGNAGFEKIVTAGTKPSAAVVGDLYIVLRANPAPAAITAKL